MTVTTSGTLFMISLHYLFTLFELIFLFFSEDMELGVEKGPLIHGCVQI